MENNIIWNWVKPLNGFWRIAGKKGNIVDLLGFRAGSKEKMVAKTDPARKADGSGGWKWSRCFGWRRARLCLVLLLRDQQALDGLAVDRTSLETDIFFDKENIYEYDRLLPSRRVIAY